MNLIDFIGFVVVMAAMVILFLKRFLEERRGRKSSRNNVDEQEEKEILKQFLVSLEGNSLSHVKQEPPPLPTFESEPEQDEFEHQIKEEKLKMRGSQRKIFHSPGEKTAYLIKGKKPLSSGFVLKGRLKEGIVLKEILGKPKGL